MLYIIYICIHTYDNDTVICYICIHAYDDNDMLHMYELESSLCSRMKMMKKWIELIPFPDFMDSNNFFTPAL